MRQEVERSPELAPESGPLGDGRPLRADARRNRGQLLAAARDVFVEQGPGAPLDEIARRAGVGIATLYRRFPDRESLMRTVVLEVLGRVGDQARLAQAEEPDALAALVRYMHRALDLRIAAVIPALLGQLTLEDEEMLRARDAAATPVEELIDAAHAEGSLRPDVTFGDIGLMIIRLSRPLPGTFPRHVDEDLAHRHLDLLVSGLATAGTNARKLSGPPLSLEDLRAMPPGANDSEQ
ncbi:MAG TPA: TetR/AcrR family transcriptional regulator [Acidimicrobiales bacterium]|nr:TetR/AcrR family transcriptional regulator [Acidimicrobiales bacterium]